MKNLQIDESQAKKLFKTSPKELQEIFISTFGESTFKEKLIDRIKTYEDVYRELKEGPINFRDFSVRFEDKIVKKVVAFAKLQRIAKLFNEGWKPDFSNHKQYKYYPWFEMNESGGVVFKNSLSYYDCSRFRVAPAYFNSEEISNYVGKTFIDIYKDLI